MIKIASMKSCEIFTSQEFEFYLAVIIYQTDPYYHQFFKMIVLLI